MGYEKVFDVTLNIQNPINFCADKDRAVRQALQSQYVGRCYKGAFICRVKEILQTSEVEIVKTNTSGAGVINVQFLAEVNVLAAGDILVGVTVVNVRQMVTGLFDPQDNTRAKVLVSLLATPETGTIIAQQKIAVQLQTVVHEPLKEYVVAVGKLLVCEESAPVYRLRGTLDKGARTELLPILENIDRELVARAKLVGSRMRDVWLFELLLYRYRSTAMGREVDQEAPSGDPNVPAWMGPGFHAPNGGSQQRNVLDIVRRVVAGDEVMRIDGLWSRSLDLYQSSPLVSWAPDGKAPEAWGEAIDGSVRAAFAEFLSRILKYLVAVREMVELYDTNESMSSHRNIWSAMRHSQQLLH